MLLSFSCENYKSIISTGISLSLNRKRISKSARESSNITVLEEKGVKALPIAIVFGANSSGKSTLFGALKTLLLLLKNGIEPSFYTPNLFLDRDETLFRLSFSYEDKIYNYQMSYNSERIIREELLENSLPVLDAKDIKKTTLPSNILSYLESFLFFSSFSPSWEEDEERYIALSGKTRKEAREQIISLMKKLDFPLYDIKKDSDGWKSEHSDGVWLSLNDESDGTRRVLSLLASFLTSLETGSVLVVDEIDISLHPILLRTLISLFLNKRYNTKNAQLICSSHNTDLMDAPYVTTSELFIFEKTKKDGSICVPVEELTSSKDKGRIRSLYLSGRLSGVPFPYI